MLFPHIMPNINIYVIITGFFLVESAIQLEHGTSNNGGDYRKEKIGKFHSVR